jgi:hypothetical protein
MSTATLERPPTQAANGQQSKADFLSPLWGDIDIPIIIGTGDFGQGKTLFGLTIAPGPVTLCYDQEGSSLTYRSIDFDHVDMAAELMKLYPDGFTPEQRFLWWRDDVIRRGKAGGRQGRYRVMMTDPMSEIEDGLADHVRKNITKFGLTSNQADKSPGLFWGVMKREWKLTLDRFRIYFDTIYGTVHLRNEFVGNSPSGKQEPKGKETLFELASLFLWFDRPKDPSGAVSAVPAANVLKSRLARTTMIDGELQIAPVLPPRLPRATPKAIRDYIATPPDYSKLKKDERVKEKEFTEEEKLRLQAQIASDQAAASQAELSRIDRMQQAAAAQAARLATTQQPPDAAGEHADRSQQKSAAATGGLVSAGKVAQIVSLFSQCFATPDDLGAWLQPKLSQWGVGKVSQLTQSQGEQLEIDLTELLARGRVADAMAKGAALLATQGPGNAMKDPPFEPSPESVQQSAEPETSTVPPAGVAELAEHVTQSLSAEKPPRPVSPSQIKEFTILLPQAFATDAELAAGVPPLLAPYGGQRFSQLTEPQADVVLANLRIKVGMRTGAAAGPNAPGSITAEQVQSLKGLAEKTGWTYDQQAEWLKQFGVVNFKGLTFNQGASRINELIKIAEGFAGGAPGN